MNKNCYGFWDKVEDIWDDFEITPKDVEILFANYGSFLYEGNAYILFKKDGKLYEVTGYHCSCNGLEGQWDPEETTIKTLKMRKMDEDYMDQLAQTGWKETLERLITI